MKIFICCSKHFYKFIPPIKEELEKRGHSITLPNSYEDPLAEERIKKESREKHISWKTGMLLCQNQKIISNDSILVLNMDKDAQKNYIGGATFLEMFKAWEKEKKIFLYNPIPNNILEDEITAFDPVILNKDLSKIK